MKIQVGGNSIVIGCTPAGKQALKAGNLTPRQRQFMLLLDEQSQLCEQAIAQLLPKLDLEALVAKGLITTVPSLSELGHPALSAALPPIVPPDKPAIPSTTKPHLKNLVNFLDAYAGAKPPVLSANPAPTRTRHVPKIPAVMPPKAVEAPSEDIVIVQSLLDN